MLDCGGGGVLPDCGVELLDCEDGVELLDCGVELLDCEGGVVLLDCGVELLDCEGGVELLLSGGVELSGGASLLLSGGASLLPSGGVVLSEGDEFSSDSLFCSGAAPSTLSIYIFSTVSDRILSAIAVAESTLSNIAAAATPHTIFLTNMIFSFTLILSRYNLLFFIINLFGIFVK